MKEITGTLGKCILLLFIGGLTGTILLILVYLLPVNTENRDASFDIIQQEGWYPRASMSIPTKWDFTANTYITDRLDGFTDEIMLQTAFNIDERSPLLQAMSSYSELVGEYSYYWHGYAVLLRPLLLIFDISNLRMFNCMCQLALLTALLFFIGREKGLPYAFMLLTSYLLLMPLALFMTLQYSWVFYIAAASTLVFLYKKDFMFEGNRIIYFFLIVGMLTSYLDLLTYPLFTWGMPLTWWLVMEKAENKAIGWLRRVIISGLSWIAGYAGLWMIKWSIASIVLKRNILESAFNEVLYRSGSAGGTESFRLMDRINTIYPNWLHYEQVFFIILLTAWGLYWVWKSIIYGWQCSTKAYAYLLIGASSFVWYFVLANHTAIHHSFTYRVFGVTLLAVLALINDGVNQEKVLLAGSMKLRILAIWAVCALLAFPLAMCAREELVVINGEEEYRQILLERGEIVEVPFKPTFNQIKNFVLGLESAGMTGEYEISLWEGEQLKYQCNIPVHDIEGEYIRQLDVDWKLDHKKTYQLMIVARDNPEDTYVWVTKGTTPLTEYGELQVGDTMVAGQLLTGVTYWCRPLAKTRLLFLILSWIGACAAISFTFLHPGYRSRKIKNSI